MDLHWLPVQPDWRSDLRTLSAQPVPWEAAIRLANARLDLPATNALDRAVAALPDAAVPAETVRLAILGSCTTGHLAPSIRIAALRRGIRVQTFEPPFGQWRQALADADGALSRFAPTAVLLAVDAHELTAGLQAGMTAAEAAAVQDCWLKTIRHAWVRLRAGFGCPILHQAALPLHPPLLGCQEHRLAGSRAAFVRRLNAALREAADEAGVDILAVDQRAERDGVRSWHDPAHWHAARQEIAPTAAPLYGELVGRWLAALRGRVAKCLVLDLDNTLWGGVIGDDGLEGIRVGPGSAVGEAFAAFQSHVRDLAGRGVILAVCSKNDPGNAALPFDRHPGMVLRQADIACFVANWADKPANLRAIAQALDIGLDALVFADDNPFERTLVRRELPMVAVPELGEDPADYPSVLADGGYFDALTVTAEDRARTALYRENRARAALRASATDLDAYLRGLQMRLTWRRFDHAGLGRIVQLINKSNQFNLTTRRYTEVEAAALIGDPDAVGLQLRLVDRFGDNGVIAIVIGRRAGRSDLFIDTWLMSCRVLGRQVEHATLAVLAGVARAMGVSRLVGAYVPSGRNGLVAGHYPALGFTTEPAGPDGGHRAWRAVADCGPGPDHITIMAGGEAW